MRTGIRSVGLAGAVVGLVLVGAMPAQAGTISGGARGCIGKSVGTKSYSSDTPRTLTTRDPLTLA